MNALVTLLGIESVDYEYLVLLFKVVLGLFIVTEVFGWIKYLLRGRS